MLAKLSTRRYSAGLEPVGAEVDNGASRHRRWAYRDVASRLADFWRQRRPDGRVEMEDEDVAIDRLVVRRMSRREAPTKRVAKLRSVHATAHRAYTGGAVRGDALLVRSSSTRLPSRKLSRMVPAPQRRS